MFSQTDDTEKGFTVFIDLIIDQVYPALWKLQFYYPKGLFFIHQGDPFQISIMNTITLSFNGVDFRLIPDPQASDAPALSSKSKQITIMPDCQSGEYQGIKLSSFTGTLFISSSPSVSLNTPMVPEEGREQNLLPKNAAVVDEEPTTPLGKGTTSDTELPCGQTQLSFGTKKRSFADTDKGKGKRVSLSHTFAFL
jgi:hypothetical protein